MFGRCQFWNSVPCHFLSGSPFTIPSIILRNKKKRSVWWRNLVTTEQYIRQKNQISTNFTWRWNKSKFCYILTCLNRRPNAAKVRVKLLSIPVSNLLTFTPSNFLLQWMSLVVRLRGPPGVMIRISSKKKNNGNACSNSHIWQ